MYKFIVGTESKFTDALDASTQEAGEEYCHTLNNNNWSMCSLLHILQQPPWSSLSCVTLGALLCGSNNRFFCVDMAVKLYIGYSYCKRGRMAGI